MRQTRLMLAAFAVVLVVIGHGAAQQDVPPPPVFAPPLEPSILPPELQHEANSIDSPARPRTLDPEQLKSIPRLAEKPSVVPLPIAPPSPQSRAAVSILVEASPEIVVDKPCRVVVTIRNVSDRTLANVAAETTLPAGLRLIGTAPQAIDLGEGRLRIVIPEMTAGAVERWAITVVPQQREAIDLRARVFISEEAGVRIAARQAQLEMTVAGETEVVYGQPLERVVTIRNIGDATAQDVRVRAILRHATEGRPAAEAEQNAGDLRPGQVRQLVFRLPTTATGPTAIAIVASATGARQEKYEQTIRVVQPRLQVALRGPGQLHLGQTTSLEIVVRNDGDGAARNVTVTLLPDEGLEWLAVSRAGQYDRATGTMHWSFPTLAAGEEQSIRVRIRAKADGESTMRVQARADFGLLAETTHRIETISRPDLSVSISKCPGTCEIGRPAELEITVENRGRKTAERVVIQAELGSSLHAAASPHYTGSGPQVTYKPLALRPGQKVVLPLTVVAAAPGEQIIRVTMESQWLARPLIVEESIFFFGDRPRTATRP